MTATLLEVPSCRDRDLPCSAIQSCGSCSTTASQEIRLPRVYSELDLVVTVTDSTTLECSLPSARQLELALLTSKQWKQVLALHHPRSSTSMKKEVERLAFGREAW